MSLAAQQECTAWIVACGRNLFLGLGQLARAGSVERARRFTSKAEAQAAAESLKIRGAMFQLPWEVRSVGTDGEVQ